MRAASKIPRRGLTDVDFAPLTCTLIKKSSDDDYDEELSRVDFTCTAQIARH